MGRASMPHVVGKLIPLDPMSPEQFVFENKVTGGRIPSEYIPSVEKGFRESLHKGPVAGYEVMGVHMRLEDGSYHDVDSSTMAFEICARDCFRETFKKADPVLLEPIMKVEVEIPTEFQGPVTGAVSSKRGVILGTESRGGYTVITAEVPLAEMFGYSNDLRSMTQGKGSFSMEFLKYQKVPSRVPGRNRQEGPAREGLSSSPLEQATPSDRILPGRSARSRPGFSFPFETASFLQSTQRLVHSWIRFIPASSECH